jgi:hypothetical protein
LIHTSGDDGNAVKKEAIYTRFSEFFISASGEKSENSFRFQMLKKAQDTAAVLVVRRLGVACRAKDSRQNP